MRDNRRAGHNREGSRAEREVKGKEPHDTGNQWAKVELSTTPHKHLTTLCTADDHSLVD